MTFALSLPIQASAAQDVFKLSLLATPATNSVTSITQSLEEQETAGKAAVEARAAALPGAQIRRLLEPVLTPTTQATNSLPVCRIRIAEPRSAQYPDSHGGGRPGYLQRERPEFAVHYWWRAASANHDLHRERSGILKPLQQTSLTPAILSVTNNLVHPVAFFPLQRQTGTVQGSICGQTASAPFCTSPFTSLEAGAYHNYALTADGTVVAWGANSAGQTTVPTGLTVMVP
ncbi:RCC1 domain-containing protein [Deinococcus sp. QL22]|uniref:RCC1 domain-containing protein n=1 Tax=Deinococcus sp. QL22 TaxID=2939437 RepID=UPI0020177CCF|nr:RCC1 domain-containing protein [Deinococcus sp. QL22]UQN08392.1 RCC1 domain-containing protein [Deinococcus sp. QL22]